MSNSRVTMLLTVKAVRVGEDGRILESRVKTRVGLAQELAAQYGGASQTWRNRIYAIEVRLRQYVSDYKEGFYADIPLCKYREWAIKEALRLTTTERRTPNRWKTEQIRENAPLLDRKHYELSRV